MTYVTLGFPWEREALQEEEQRGRRITVPSVPCHACLGSGAVSGRFSLVCHAGEAELRTESLHEVILTDVIAD